MNDKRNAKIVLKGKMDGVKRPRTVWMIAEKRTGISLPRTEEQAQDREKWRKIAQNVILIIYILFILTNFT